VTGRVEIIQQALRVKRAAGSGDGNNDLQSGKRIMAHYGEVELSGQVRFAQPTVWAGRVQESERAGAGTARPRKTPWY